MITVLTIDSALQDICATFREHADQGDITPVERDLLMDGAVLLAMHVDDLAQAQRVGSDTYWPEGAAPRTAGRHERRAAAVAA